MLRDISPERLSLLQNCQRILACDFENIALLDRALTHSSYINENRLKHLSDNERLEFLGDAVLKLVISEFLYFNFPGHHEGELTKIRSVVISDYILAQEAKRLDIGTFVLLGDNERKNSGQLKERTLGNAMEAIFGAYYCDRGLEQAKVFILSILKPILHEIAHHKRITDFKSHLQEFSQKEGLELPKYTVVQELGPDHSKLFKYEARLAVDNTVHRAVGQATSKKGAEQEAAKNLLKELQLI